MLDLKALPLLRKNLDEFIKADPVTIVLTRRDPQRTASGGWTQGPPRDLPSQQFRTVPFKRRLSNTRAQTADGDVISEDWVLVGRINVDIRRDDTFYLNGDKYKVTNVEPKTNDRSKTDRVVAEVLMQGKDPSPPESRG